MNWVLNLAAELELRGEAIGRGTRQAIRRGVSFLRGDGALVSAGDAVLVPDGDAPIAGRIGLCWSPTPSALAVLREARLPTIAVDESVLRAVTSRAFSHALGTTLPGAVFVRSSPDAMAILRTPAPGGRGWRTKRALGMAGRGHKVFRGPVDAAGIRWLEAAAPEGLVIEPEVEILSECSIHGWISARGSLLVGDPVGVSVDGRGGFSGIDPVPALSPTDVSALSLEAERVASALSEAGYVGPFGVDAFHWRDEHGISFRVRSEVNARFTMAYGIGMRARPWREAATEAARFDF